MSRASVDALPLIHTTSSAFNLGLRASVCISTLLLKVCRKKQENQAAIFNKFSREFRGHDTELVPERKPCVACCTRFLKVFWKRRFSNIPPPLSFRAERGILAGADISGTLEDFSRWSK
jgi:hypothetical protein